MIPKTAPIDNKLMDVITEDEYKENWRSLVESSGIYHKTAVEIERDGRELILPLRGKMDDRPGVVNDGSIYFLNLPDENDHTYDKSGMEIIDIKDSQNITDFLEKNDQIRNMENTILTDVDDMYKPIIGENDSPFMKAFKEAVGLKHCDISKYAPRFGDNFLNDRRLLKGEDITIKKAKEISDYLDMEIEIRIRDKSSDVPNPIGKEISTIITGEVNSDDNG